MTTDPTQISTGGDQDPAPSGLRRLIMALLFPDVLAWGWIVTVVVIVWSRPDARLGSAATATAAFALAAAASVAIGYAIVAVGEEGADDTTLRRPAIVASIASSVLWLCAFWLSFIAEIAL